MYLSQEKVTEKYSQDTQTDYTTLLLFVYLVINESIKTKCNLLIDEASNNKTPLDTLLILDAIHKWCFKQFYHSIFLGTDTHIQIYPFYNMMVCPFPNGSKLQHVK